MKHKVVIVNPDRGAKIHTTPNPESFSCEPHEELLIDPNTKMVDNLPPEMWKCVDGRLVPITEEHEVARRVLTSQTLPFLKKSIEAHNYDLGSALEEISKIKLIEPAFDDVYSMLVDIDKRNEKRAEDLSAKLETQKKILMLIIALLLGEFLIWLI
jgi:hypothetical protein